jgi:superoxide dismutase, Fe-Mn family
MNHLTFFRAAAAAAFCLLASATLSLAQTPASAPASMSAATPAGPFTLAPLPYDAAALAPHIDAETMTIHHDRHHKTYVDNLNRAVEGTPMANQNIDVLVRSIDTNAPAAVRNNAGGHWNHTFFWNMLSPKGGGVPKGAVADAINKKYGSFDKFKAEWAKAATARFGSGWVWLIKNGTDLEITSTPNQDNPLMKLADKKGTPILGLDVWEHAYYLKYQNKRADYVTAVWNVVDWDKVSKNFE